MLLWAKRIKKQLLEKNETGRKQHNPQARLSAGNKLSHAVRPPRPLPPGGRR